ncbi:MAG: fatty acid transporter, partial [Alphaproteobacteria bacterium]|nr:fatty acid transporter [Alphaproteobacteria bacterium]
MGKRSKWLVTGLTSLGTATAAGGAFASGFQLRENSAAALGNAFAGAAASVE